MFTKKEYIQLRNGHLKYIVFGQGKPLVIFPGLGDGLQTVHQANFITHHLFKTLKKYFRIYVVSYIDPLNSYKSTEELAEYYFKGLVELKLSKINLMGLSLGGMVAQYLAAKNGAMIDKLILCSTTAKTEKTLAHKINKWIELADFRQDKELVNDIINSIYNKTSSKLIAKVFSKKIRDININRFIYLAQAVKNHNASFAVKEINSKTLVIGGTHDSLIPADEFIYLKKCIPNSRLIVIPGGHCLFQEDKKEFFSNIQQFMENNI